MALCTSNRSSGCHGEASCDFLCGPGNSGHKNFTGAGAQKHAGAFAGRGPGGHDIVDDEDSTTADLVRPGHGKGPAHIGPALMTCEAGLRRSFTPSDQESGIQLDACSPPGAHKRSRNLLRLVEPAHPPFARPQGYRNHQQQIRQTQVACGFSHKSAQHRSRRLDLMVFEQMKKIAKGAFVSAVSHSTAERRRRTAAQSAQGAGLTFKMMAEQFLAAGAAQNAVQCRNLLQTWPADRKSGNRGQWRLANATITGKQDGEQTLSRELERPSGPA